MLGLPLIKQFKAAPSHLSALCYTRREVHMPGWKTMSSTRDVRSREQREADRKVRQIEKLPKPEALHDFQYPFEKTVLSDGMFQYPVFANELDTPHLFHLTPPPNFFLYWNASDFERTAYPPVPEEDHRLFVPGDTAAAWSNHRTRSLKYLAKHELVPHYVPHIHQDVNLSVVFPGTFATRARVDDETGLPLPPPPPETHLTKRNFWFTAHCGNYIELTDLQQAPSVFFMESEADWKEEAYYTLVILSPDFPYRVPSYADRGCRDRGFFLNYMVANLPGGATSSPPPVANGVVLNTDGLAKQGDTVISYLPPLPTEDAGTTRHVCLLYKQTRKVSITPLTAEEEQEHFPLAKRSQYRLHASVRGKAYFPAALHSLTAVEEVLPPVPSAASFFQTKWDIQVQEYYEKVGLPEPASPVDEEIEALLEFHARRPSDLRVRARHRPDGSTNMGDDPNFWGQVEPTRILDGSMQRHWSRRTAMGANGVPVTYPH